MASPNEQKTDGGAPATGATAEGVFTRARVIGLIAGPLVGLLVYLLMPDMPLPLVEGEDEAVVSANGRTVAAVTAFIAIWWATEAIPIPVTSLLPLVLFPVMLEGTPIKDVASSYGSDTIFLFMGGFMLALAMQKWDLHKRIALTIVSKVGSNSAGLIGGFMLATGFITMWVSNTATAVMMLPVGLSVITVLTQFRKGRTDANFATALMLGIAYAASIGSVATIIGTPPNVLMVGYLSDTHGITIGFGQWMLAGVPLAAVFLLLAWFVLIKVFPPQAKRVEGAQETIRAELAGMGSMSRGEKGVSLVFALAALSWIFIPILAGTESVGGALPWLANISDAGIAMTVAVVLFLVPVDRQGTRLLDWETAVRLPWGVLLLFGGGLAISAQFTASGLSAWIGGQVSALAGVPVWVLILVAAALVLFLTELTSNTATAATFLPILGGVAMGMDMDVLTLVVPVALAASMAFMLPVATPPNAIVFGTGHVRIGEMIRGGLWLNLIALALVLGAMYALFSWALGITL
ncbi:Sodium-dependent dicarboxylate transporter SdcS [Nocardiopsis dassonvillei]|uniref:SLC13 family permease n=1 Tax=Nocardiopsis dassonvillei TaxID=2014 RepID=UPI003F5466D6